MLQTSGQQRAHAGGGPKECSKPEKLSLTDLRAPISGAIVTRPLEMPAASAKLGECAIRVNYSFAVARRLCSTRSHYAISST
jgi:hypothetical protein